MRRPATQRMQKAEMPLPPQAAALAAQSQIANRKSQIPWWLLAVILVLGTIAVYWPATGCGFVNLDDSINVSGNINVQKGLTRESIKWALFNPVNGGWLPLTVWSHMLVCQVFGLKPWGHHLINVLLHALNAALVFAWLRQVTGATWRSLLVAALFAVHPLRVEAVAWVTERREVLSAFFGLLALMAYARYVQSRRQNAEATKPDPATLHTHHAPRATQHVSRFTFPACTCYLLSLLSLALGLMSKPMLVTWPFVMLLLDYWPLGRMQNPAASDTQHATRNPQHVSRTTLPSLLLEKIPFFVLVAAESIVLLLVQKRGGSLAAGESLPLVVRVETAVISYSRYLRNLCWPMDLVAYYPHPEHWPLGQSLWATGLILGISVLVWASRRRYPYLLMGWLWYCGTLVPVSQVIQTGAHAMADRWTYLPSLGLLILAIWGGCELTRGWRYQAVAWSVAGAAAIVLCLALTRQQIGYWKDGETLFRHALAVTENNAIARDALGAALDSKGQFDEAIRQFQESVRLKPAYADAHYNLGVAFFQRGRTAEAIHEFQEALRLEPDHARAHNNLGAALGRQGQTDEAIREFQEALRLKPDYTEARKNLNILLANKAAAAPPPGGSVKP